MAKIAIYAGHGGSDPGACANGRREKDLTLKIANETSNILRGAGHDILQNRTTDANRNITTDANKSNSWGANYVVEFHLNSGGGTGTETYCSVIGGASRSLATAINNRMASLGFRDRGVKTRTDPSGKDYFGIIRQTNAPCVLCEVCFIDSASDMALFDSISNLSNHIADEIHNFVSGGSPQPTPPQPSGKTNIDYQANIGGREQWLPMVRDLTDDAGLKNRTIEAIYARPTSGSLTYRVHLLNGGWLSWVTTSAGDNGSHKVDDYAGIIGREIDGIQFKGNITYRAKVYGGSWLPEVTGENDYAGILGKRISNYQCWFK